MHNRDAVSDGMKFLMKNGHSLTLKKL